MAELPRALEDHLRLIMGKHAPPIGSNGGGKAEASQQHREVWKKEVMERLNRQLPIDANLQTVTAIVLALSLRPALQVQGGEVPAGDKAGPFKTWLKLREASLRAVIAATGRIFFTSGDGRARGIGTGVLVRPRIVMTNRHVAELFCHGVGDSEVRLAEGHTAQIGFAEDGAEDNRQDARLEIIRPLLIHPYWDMALLEICGERSGHVTLESFGGPLPKNQPVVVIGYPAMPGDGLTSELRHQFESLLAAGSGNKHFMPGEVMSNSFETISQLVTAPAFKHDCSTLAGASGSPVVDLVTGRMVGLHAGGWMGNYNYAMPVAEMLRHGPVRRLLMPEAAAAFEPIPAVEQTWLQMHGRAVLREAPESWMARETDPARQPAFARKPSPLNSPQTRFEGTVGSNGEDGTPQPRSLVFDARPDIIDLRDVYYRPSLLDVSVRSPPPALSACDVLDQGAEGYCTGHALAAIINLLTRHRSFNQNLPADKFAPRVNARMLYEMARIHDEWPGEDYTGSSVRGVVKGFFHNGVCTEALSERLFKDKPRSPWSLTFREARDARNISLGAYYRLGEDIIHYHAAICETRAIIVSAKIHEGWLKPRDGKIRRTDGRNKGHPFIGTHAFAIVGYDDEGFIVLNSWGPGWGGRPHGPGMALWDYDDWAENISDAWVLRLAIPSANAFEAAHTRRTRQIQRQAAKAQEAEPRRQDVIGHFLHIDDGQLIDSGRYATPLDSIEETATYLSSDGITERYKHILFYAHGGLNGPADSARRIAQTREGFKRNGIYPFHFMWETGITEEFGDLIGGIARISAARAGNLREILNLTIEKLAGGIGRKFWREMKNDAARAFIGEGLPLKAVLHLLSLPKNYKLHLACHSAGAILIAGLLDALKNVKGPDRSKLPRFETLTMFAPACTEELYRRSILPELDGVLPGLDRPMIGAIHHYNLGEDRELGDTVGPYQSSLLWLVSNAFEERPKTPLLGLEAFSGKLVLPRNHHRYVANGYGLESDSRSHGGFDNDRVTMQHLLKTILQKEPPDDVGFQESELSGY